ncbi:MAG: hypothetical protein M3Q22_16150 [Actinomycetota bacterium]|nr:hypothetical protein [Actinomycetota bacterium]
MSVTAVVLLLAIGVCLEISARRRNAPATVAQTLGAAMRTAPGRWTVLVA